MKKLGNTKKGYEVYRSEFANNQHMVATGESGTGKSTTMALNVLENAKVGERTIVINWRNCFNPQMLMPEIYEEYRKYAKRIDVAKGMELNLFERMRDSNGNLETAKNVIERVTTMLKIAVDLSPTQESTVYEAVEDTYCRGLYEEDGIQIIVDWLQQQDKAVASNAAAKLRCICGNNLFRAGDFLDDHPIIELDLNGLEYDVQLKVVKFLMDYLLRMANKGLFLEDGLNVFLDEAQNMDFCEGSTLFSMINEGRKLNLRLMLAAPSIISSAKKGMSVVTQCGTQLYFAPLRKERRMIAEMIDPQKTDKYVFALSRLDKGEFIACGRFNVNDKEVLGPIPLSTDISI